MVDKVSAFSASMAARALELKVKKLDEYDGYYTCYIIVFDFIKFESCLPTSYISLLLPC